MLWDGDSFESAAPGVTVTGLTPGDWSEDYPVYFQSSGEGPLYLRASVPETPALPEGMDDYGFSGWENLKVAIKGYCAPAGEESTEHLRAQRRGDWTHWGDEEKSRVVRTDMAALLAGDVELPCGPLAEGAVGDANTPNTAGNYSLSFKIKPDAITGESAGVGNFNIVFTGSLSEQ